MDRLNIKYRADAWYNRWNIALIIPEVKYSVSEYFKRKSWRLTSLFNLYIISIQNSNYTYRYRTYEFGNIHFRTIRSSPPIYKKSISWACCTSAVLETVPSIQMCGRKRPINNTCHSHFQHQIYSYSHKRPSNFSLPFIYLFGEKNRLLLYSGQYCKAYGVIYISSIRRFMLHINWWRAKMRSFWSLNKEPTLLPRPEYESAAAGSDRHWSSTSYRHERIRISGDSQDCEWGPKIDR